jgi:hypothetical protein
VPPQEENRLIRAYVSLSRDAAEGASLVRESGRLFTAAGMLPRAVNRRHARLGAFPREGAYGNFEEDLERTIAEGKKLVAR